jgi:hypothetical protein
MFASPNPQVFLCLQGEWYLCKRYRIIIIYLQNIVAHWSADGLQWIIAKQRLKGSTGCSRDSVTPPTQSELLKTAAAFNDQSPRMISAVERDSNMWIRIGQHSPILTCAKGREFSGMICWQTINNPSNPHSHPFPTFSTSKSWYILK